MGFDTFTILCIATTTVLGEYYNVFILNTISDIVIYIYICVYKLYKYNNNNKI